MRSFPNEVSLSVPILEKIHKLSGHHGHVRDHIEQRHFTAPLAERHQLALELADVAERWLWERRSATVRHAENRLQLPSEVSRLLWETDSRVCNVEASV